MSFLSGFSVSVLDIGQRVNRSGIGLSHNSRQMLKTFMSSSNALMGALGASADGANSIEAMQLKIKALRANTNTSQLSRDLQDERTASKNPDLGNSVDTEA